MWGSASSLTQGIKVLHDWAPASLPSCVSHALLPFSHAEEFEPYQKAVGTHSLQGSFNQGRDIISFVF